MVDSLIYILKVMKKYLEGNGFGLLEAKTSIDIVHKIRNSEPLGLRETTIHFVNYECIYSSYIIVDDNVSIGIDTKIWHFSHILSETSIGDRCSFGQNCVIGPRVKVGNGVKVQNNISIYEGVEIEDDVFLGPSMVFTNVINPRKFYCSQKNLKTLLKKAVLLVLMLLLFVD